MATIPSTKQEFLKDVEKFTELCGFKTTTIEQVQAAHKCMNLRYLGLSADIPYSDILVCAMHKKIATEGAIARGWEL